MTLAANNRMLQIEQRLKSLEEAINLLLKSHDAPNLEDLPVIQKIKDEIQGIKMRAGRKFE